MIHTRNELEDELEKAYLTGYKEGQEDAINQAEAKRALKENHNVGILSDNSLLHECPDCKGRQ